MPIIDMPVDALLARIAAGDDGPRLTVGELAELLPKLGCEVEELAEMQQFACGVCEKMFDRTEAQGPPLHCTHCGADFRARPADLAAMGHGQVLRLNLLAVRPDLFDCGGMARYVRGYLGVQTGLAEYVLAAPRLRVKVDPALARDESYRPFIACAVVRNVALDHASIKMLMNLQEDLHWALGRNRKLASIGVYDLDTLSGDVIHYDAVDPDGLRFVPLGFDPKSPGAALTPREVLERHKTGVEFAHLLKPLKRYPLLRDGAGTVLSMPPIINSEQTRVTMKTRSFFVDVTGLSQRTVDRALNILVTSLTESLPNVVLETVVIEGAGEPRFTPDLSPVEIELDVREAADTIGAELNAGELSELLESMGHSVSPVDGGAALLVQSPAYRNDVMHAVDLIEDAAVAFGYEHLAPSLVPTFTVGAARPIEEWAAVGRRAMTGLGFHQVLTLVLTNEAEAFAKWGWPPDARAVRIENPISSEQTICRVSLLPGLLGTLAINKQYDLPQQIFEIGDCSVVDASAETGAVERRMMAAAIIGTHVGYADVRAVLDAFVHELRAECSVQPVENPAFIAGRAAAVCDARGAALGLMGEVHPQVLENYGLRHAAAVVEVDFTRLIGVRLGGA